MRDGTAKLLAACRGSNQAIEVAKNLLVSNTRLGVYMEEMRHCKSEEMRFLLSISFLGSSWSKPGSLLLSISIVVHCVWCLSVSIKAAVCFTSAYWRPAFCHVLCCQCTNWWLWNFKHCFSICVLFNVVTKTHLNLHFIITHGRIWPEYSNCKRPFKYLLLYYWVRLNWKLHL